jgi:hypothetical protein
MILKTVVPILLSLSDNAVRVFINRARFAARRSGLSYPRYSFLARVLGGHKLYTCAHCGGSLYYLNKGQRIKQNERLAEKTDVIECADRELLHSGLEAEVKLRNRYASFPGMRLMLPDGTVHAIPKTAPYGTFFIVPAFIFDCGATAIWADKRRGVIPVSEQALKLLLILLSGQHVERFGGVNPVTIHARDAGLSTAGLLSMWNPSVLKDSLNELELRNIVGRNSSIVSQYDGHLIRQNDVARFPDEIMTQVFRVRDSEPLALKSTRPRSLLVSQGNLDY